MRAAALCLIALGLAACTNDYGKFRFVDSTGASAAATGGSASTDAGATAPDARAIDAGVD
jgi:hypothetical protein